MAIISKILGGLFYKGGFLSLGTLGLIFNKSGHLPKSTYHVSYVLFAAGVLGVALKIKKFIEDDDPDHDARMQEFYRLKPELERHIREHAILNFEYQRLRRIMFVTDEMEKASREYERIISAYERRMAEAEAEGIEIQRSIEDKDDGSKMRRNSLQLSDIAKLSRFYCVF